MPFTPYYFYCLTSRLGEIQKENLEAVEMIYLLNHTVPSPNITIFLHYKKWEIGGNRFAIKEQKSIPWKQNRMGEEQRVAQVELAKQRCKCVIDAINSLPCSTNITVSCRRTLLKLARAELAFLSYPSSSSVPLRSLLFKFVTCLCL